MHIVAPGENLAKIAARCMAGRSLDEQGIAHVVAAHTERHDSLSALILNAGVLDYLTSVGLLDRA
mgnify:CR=1 FL=1